MTERRDFYKMAAMAAADKKAEDIVILNMEKISLITDHFIICTGTSTPHTKAIADHIEEKLKEEGIRLLHKEGYREGHWILLDFGSCVVHVFREEDRRFYNLERLWGDARKVAHPI